MKFSPLATSLISLSLAAAQQVVFFAQNTELKISGPLESVNVASDSSLVVINEAGQGSKFDLKYNSAISINGKLGTQGEIGSGSYLAAGNTVSSTDSLKFEGNKLVNFHYWACQQLDVLLSLNSQYFVAATKGNVAPAPQCYAIEITKVVCGNNVETGHTAWTNGTVDMTVYDYVTYCPSPTTITVTQCDSECVPQTITVKEAGTVTVSGLVILPTATGNNAGQDTNAANNGGSAKMTAAPKATVDAESRVGSSTAESEYSAAPVIAFSNGVSRNIASVAGLVAFGALLI